MRTLPIAFLLALLVACGEPAPSEAPQPEAPAAPAAVEPEPQAEAATPEVTEPGPEAPPEAELRSEPEPAPVAARPPAPAEQKAKPKPAPQPEPPVAAAPPPAPEPAPAPETPPEVAVPAPAFDLDGLEQRLKATPALGVFTKLALKNEIDDLIDDVGKFHRKQRGQLAALHERFELLVMKVTSLLQDKEPELAQEIAGAREGLWKLLADPGEFAKLSA